MNRIMVLSLFLKKYKEYVYNNTKENNMKRYVCPVCGYVYDESKGDPSNGIAPGTKFEDLPSDWVCPICGTSKDAFVEE